MKVTGKLDATRTMLTALLVSSMAIVAQRTATRSLGGLYAQVHDELGLGNRALASMVTGFIALAIIVSIGVVILSSVDTAMPTLDESSAYYNLSTTVSTTTVSGYGLIVIVLIIVAAAAIMGAVYLIQRK